MGLSDQSRRWLDCIGLSAGSYRIGWIISVNTGFCALDGYWLYGTDGTDVLDETLVGRGWDGLTLADAITGAPPLALERELQNWLLRDVGRWEVVDGTNCFGATRARSICV